MINLVSIVDAGVVLIEFFGFIFTEILYGFI